MRLKCFVALCCITLLAVGWFIPLVGCNARTHEPIDTVVDRATERKISSDYTNLPYVSIREAARRQWCKDRGLVGPSSMYRVQPIGSTDMHGGGAAVEWCDTSIAAGSFDSH